MSARAPLATYRLQFNSRFTFFDAIPVLDYLRELGISHVYASPVLASRTGSNHGYDVIDPTRIDPEMGGEEGFSALLAALEERGMGILLDIVPNHMAASRENRWWMETLEYGPDSPFASYFDIDWKAPSRTLENKLLLPFLGKPFAEVLESGELKISWEDGKFMVRYWDQVFPVAPGAYSEILRCGDTEAGKFLQTDSPAAQEWRGILALAEAIALDAGSGTQAAAERRTRFESMRERLRQLVIAAPQAADLIQRTLAFVNGKTGEPRSFTSLERILAGQNYRLAYWQTPSDAINYRRFFSITDLVGVRVEDPSVFDAVQDTAIRLGKRPNCAGFRIDHIDGLRDPQAYLKRLRERSTSEGGQRTDGDEPYIVVEKILGRREWLPEEWPIQGTTGYDYMNFAGRVLVDEKKAKALEEVYSNWTGVHWNFDDVLYDKKKLVMRTLMGVEMRSLGRELGELARDDRYARELHPAEVSEALIEVTACLGVYRTYIQTLEVPEQAKHLISHAIERARDRRPTLAGEYFNFASDVLLLATADHIRPEQREARLAFVTRWQQFTGSIMAKGFEDTALYVYFPLASLNEVGGDPRLAGSDPGGLGAGPQDFHAFITERARHWPHSMNATTTHDTKRSEDTRARIAVLSEIPEQWEEALRRWSGLNEKHNAKVDGITVPDRNEECLIYQTLIGSWPLRESDWDTFVSRVQDYIIKAAREAQVHTRWINPHQAHETALRQFVGDILDGRGNGNFCRDFAKFQDRTSMYGMLNGLGQTLLKITSPGVPDFYQGADLWDLRLVDPDNRGVIDFNERAAILAALRQSRGKPSQQSWDETIDCWRDGRIKMHAIRAALGVRRAFADLFDAGCYTPIAAEGTHADRLIAYARVHNGESSITIIPRCVASLDAPVAGKNEREAFWSGTRLPLPDGAPIHWKNALARIEERICGKDGYLNVGHCFRNFPVALLQPA